MLSRLLKSAARLAVLGSVCAAVAVAQDDPPRTAAELSVAADGFAAADSFDAAIASYSEALALDGEYVPAFIGRARAYEDLGDYAVARRDLDTCLQLAPDRVEALFARGRVLNMLGELDGALSDLTKALEAMPEDPEVLAWRGMTHFESGRFEDADTDFSRAVVTEKEDAWILHWFGSILWQEDENERALEVLVRAVELDGESAWVLDLLARVELEQSLFTDGLRHVDAAIRLEPDQAAFHWTRGRILQALGRNSEATETFETARNLDPAYGGAAQSGDDVRIYLLNFVPLLGFLVFGLAFLTLIGLSMSRSTRAAMEAVPAGHVPARFDGRTSELFKLYLENVVLTLLTVGIYRFWAKVNMTRYRYQHTAFAGGRFDYHATGLQKFRGFVRGMLVLAPVLGILYLGYRLLVPQTGGESAFIVCFWLFLLILFCLRPLILVGSQRFNLSRTSWNNLRFRFTGKVGDAYRLYLTDTVLIVCTFGIYTVWHQCNVRQFRLQHTRMGDVGFDYRGNGAELFGITMLGGILSYLTLGIYLPWYIARVARFHVENTTFRRYRFQSRLTGGQVLSVGAPAILAIILTLGLAIPWALNRWYRLVTNTTSYPGPIDLDELRSIHDEGAGAMLEGVGEAGEAIADIGELFGG